MKLRILACGLAVAAFSAGAATGAGDAAADDGAKAKRGVAIEELEARAARRFARVDADGDGRITAEEFAASRMDRRGRRDGDADGRPRRGGERRDGRRRGDRFGGSPFGERAFDAADADGDGQLSREEWRELPRAARAAARERMFARLDANDDGGLDADEFGRDMARLKALDADGDGRLTRSEMRDGRKRHRGGRAREDAADG